MARRGGERFEKRRLEAARRERQAAKRDRKAGPEDGGDTVDGVVLSEAEAMERFAALSAQRASGEVDEETYEAEGRELFAVLGLDWPTD